MCDHEDTIEIATRCYTGPVSVDDQNPAAHGGICVEEECAACGSRRKYNVNGCHVEYGGWHPVESDDER